MFQKHGTFFFAMNCIPHKEQCTCLKLEAYINYNNFRYYFVTNMETRIW
jgi:hypothetical protein